MNSNLIKDEIFKLAKSGATIIFSTHRMEQVEEICDQIVLVNKDQKILDGTVREVKQQFKKNLFRISFDSMPLNTNNDSFSIVKQNDDYSLVVKINNGYSPNDILRYFLHSNVSIHSFNEILPSLNDIFIQLVEGTPATRQFQNLTA